MKKRKVEKKFVNFVDYCRKLSHAKTHILNPIRYAEMEKCYHAMEKVAQENSGKLSFDVRTESGFGSIRMESDDLIWYPHQGLFAALMLADNLEVYPLKSGKIRTSLMFYGITKALEEERK